MPAASNDSQVATSSWVTMSDLDLDTNTGSYLRIIYFLSAADADVQAKVQGSVNGTTYVDLNTLDVTGNDVQDAVITVPEDGTAVAVISPENLNGINSAWRYYRLQIKGSASPYGTLTAYLFAK